MHRTTRLLIWLGCGLLVSALSTGCGAKDSSGADADAVSKPYDTAQKAAMGFSSWFEADATECDVPDFVLLGTLPKRIMDGYSCKQVMSPAEVSQRCERGTMFSSGAPNKHPVKLSADKMKWSVAWGAVVTCPGVKHHKGDQGTYQVIVQKSAKGWSVTSYKILTGPGAGQSG